MIPLVDWKSKLTSRKFWTAIAEFVTMLIMAFHGTQETATQVAALIMAGAAVIAYIIGEGMADAAGAKTMLTYTDGWEDGYKTKQEEINEDVGEVQS